MRKNSYYDSRVTVQKLKKNEENENIALIETPRKPLQTTYYHLRKGNCDSKSFLNRTYQEIEGESF